MSSKLRSFFQLHTTRCVASALPLNVRQLIIAYFTCRGPTTANLQPGSRHPPSLTTILLAFKAVTYEYCDQILRSSPYYGLIASSSFPKRLINLRELGFTYHVQWQGNVPWLNCGTIYETIIAPTHPDMKCYTASSALAGQSDRHCLSFRIMSHRKLSTCYS